MQNNDLGKTEVNLKYEGKEKRKEEVTNEKEFLNQQYGLRTKGITLVIQEFSRESVKQLNSKSH